MDQQTFNNLKPGDRIVLKSTGTTYTVEKPCVSCCRPAHYLRNEGTDATAMAWHPGSWDLIPPPERSGNSSPA